MPRHNYRVGVPQGGFWKEILNSDAKDYGGSGQGNMGGVEASPASFYGQFDYSLSVTLPPWGSWSSSTSQRAKVPPPPRPADRVDLDSQHDPRRMAVIE